MLEIAEQRSLLWNSVYHVPRCYRSSCLSYLYLPISPSKSYPTSYIGKNSAYLQLPLQHRPPVRHDDRPIDMAPRPTRQKHHQPRNILGLPQPPIRRLLLQRLHAPLDRDQPVGHLARVEPRRDGVAQDVSGPQLDGQVLGQVDDGRLGGGVAEGGIVAQGADADARGRGGDDDARGGVACRAGLEEGGEPVRFPN